MKVLYHKKFVKSYKKRIAPNTKMQAKFSEQLKKFLTNPNDPSLRDHKLIGKKAEYRAFSITGDIRVVYKIVKNNIWLYDVGSHNQVY